MHTGSVSSDGVNVTYTIDGVSHTIPAGTAMAVTDPQTGSVVSVGQGTLSLAGAVNLSGAGVGGTFSGSGGDFSPDSNGATGPVRRSVNIVNGQMTVTTTQNGVTTTSTSPAPSTAATAPLLSSGAIVSGSASGDSQTMTIVDQNGVTHTVQAPMGASGVGSGAVMITTNPDGTTNVLQITPAQANP
jgi:hypothetical protein